LGDLPALSVSFYYSADSSRTFRTECPAPSGLQYSRYPIEQLCDHSTYLEVAYLIINGELPTRAELEEWVHEVTIHTFVHENIKDFMHGPP